MYFEALRLCMHMGMDGVTVFVQELRRLHDGQVLCLLARGTVMNCHSIDPSV
jgi:hypothetical protein